MLLVRGGAAEADRARRARAARRLARARGAHRPRGGHTQRPERYVPLPIHRTKGEENSEAVTLTKRFGNSRSTDSVVILISVIVLDI